MIRRARIPDAYFLLIVVSFVFAFLVDQSVTPRDQFVATPFAVPVLIAAYRFPTRVAITTAVLALGLASYSAHYDEAALVPVLFHLLGLLLASILAILLGHQRRVASRLARESHELLQQSESARNTLRTVIETMPAGVLITDARGMIVLANPVANEIYGSEVSGTAYGLTKDLILERPDGTPFPADDLPLHRAIERGESSANVEIRVRPEGGTERVILSAASPVRDAEGRIVNAVAVFQDLTERIETEEALRTSQESLARAQEVAHLGNWDRDLSTGHLRWSDEIYRIFGMKPQEFAGTFVAFLEAVHPNDREQVTGALQEALDEGRPYSLDHRIVCPDGAIRIVHEEARVMRDAAGQPIRLVGTVQDITERKQVEEERERLLRQVEVERARMEAIFNGTANAIIFVDAASKQVQANPAAIQLFGHPFVPEDGQAQYVSQMLHPDGRPITLEELPSRWALQGQTTIQKELVVVQPNGTRVPVLESAAPVRVAEGQVVGAVLVFQDISALKEVERLREEWTSVIAHDLRQPVTVIVGYASLLGRDEFISSNWHREIGHIMTAAQNLSKMIEDLLDVSRIEAHRLVLRLQPVDLPTLVEAVVERVIAIGPPSEPRQLIRVEVLGQIRPVLADPGRIEQVLGNLLSNAVKYGDPNEEITVTAQQRGDNAVVSVTNRGPGIPPDEVSNLFTRFYRTKNARAGRAAGLGLGLYISKGIVEAHQGQIWVESIPNQTTTFSFTLPSAPDGTPSDPVLDPSLAYEE